MNVNTAIRESILTYPGLYATGGDVLHDLLCVIGNGFAWENGEIVMRVTDNRPHWTPSYEEQRWDVESLEMVGQEHLDATIAENMTRVANVDGISKDYTLALTTSFYPQFASALLMNVPEDVTPDWQEAVTIMKQTATEHGWKF